MKGKQAIIARKLSSKREKLNEAKRKRSALMDKKRAIQKRADELEEEIDALAEEAVSEQMESIEAEIDEQATELAAVEEELAAIEEIIAAIEEEIGATEEELTETNSRARRASTEARHKPDNRERGYLRKRSKFGTDLSSIVTRTDVKDFLTRVREHKGQTRAVKGAQLGIPDVMLELLRDNLNRYSKLLPHINVRSVRGYARQNIAGVVPEGVWTEACASLNELDITFSQVEADGFKVGGFVPICNSTLDDSDLNLADEILDMLGQAIGYAVDKSIPYGTGRKMPLGIVTRLAQSVEPSDWNANGPEWVDLHTTNIIKLNPSNYETAESFFSALMLAASVAKANYSNGTRLWMMNETTWNEIVAKTVTFNATGALVASEQMTMPIIGGQIELLDFIPHGDIIGGYSSLYLMVERQGSEFEMSEHVRFLDDQTLFKATARYDGMPVIGNGFVLINITNATPTVSVPFAPDGANHVVQPIVIPAAGSYAGPLDVHLYTPTPAAYIYYTTDGSTPTKKSARYNGTPVTLAESASIKAMTVKAGSDDSVVTTAAYTIT